YVICAGVVIGALFIFCVLTGTLYSKPPPAKRCTYGTYNIASGYAGQTTGTYEKPGLYSQYEQPVSYSAYDQPGFYSAYEQPGSYY
ncbi:unnamed protein product, partial [Enterobius vermicularis]|uniref:Secreted protein n=1 Tax=Enterobius vermicularis TaxID=51028 RepID=A0A0N4VHG3_ENTVE